MAKLHASGKRLQIDKANSTMFITVAVAAFVITFSLVAGKALMNTRAYQSRIIKEKEVAAKQLKENIEASKSLVTSYKAFVEAPENIIGGNPNGTGERDGDNAKIVLDALPSKYDYPALSASLEKLIASQKFEIKNIEGTDDEVAQSGGDKKAEPVEMPFNVDISGNVAATKDLLVVFERSIRPIKVQTIQFDMEDTSQMTVLLSASSYYQPAKTLKIETKEVK